jgi:purine nucleosidase/pyrimidine-specific ribonucleoside hydrolase
MAVPVILDCDPGHDDVFAIWLAAADPNIDLRAITTVGGNGYLRDTTRNALIATMVAGVEDVPVAPGADEPLVRRLDPAAHIHGSNALGGPRLPEPARKADEHTALELMCEVIDASEEPVVLNATGPLTNVAHLVQREPAHARRLREIVWMGGSTERGNITPYAEFNGWVDPEAAEIVVKSGIPFTMIGLNVTHQALITDEVVARIAAIGSRTAAFGVELLDFFRSTYVAHSDLPTAPLHDPVTTALIAYPGIVACRRTRLDIETAGTETAGATSVDLLGILGRPDNARVGLELDVARFWDVLIGALASLA